MASFLRPVLLVEEAAVAQSRVVDQIIELDPVRLELVMNLPGRVRLGQVLREDMYSNPMGILKFVLERVKSISPTSHD